MTIEFNEATQSCNIDAETYKRLTTGTDFQRSMNVLGMMDQIGYEMACDAVAAAGLTGPAREALLKKMRQSRMQQLLKTPPPGIDRDALEVFCK